MKIEARYSRSMETATLEFEMNCVSASRDHSHDVLLSGTDHAVVRSPIAYIVSNSPIAIGGSLHSERRYD
jgi:hypothetical protein